MPDQTEPTGGTITVTLAEVPTDVLVYLVDNGAASLDTLVMRIAPYDAERVVRSKIHNAASLLVEGGWAVCTRSATGERIYAVTQAGRRAVMKARANPPADGGCAWPAPASMALCQMSPTWRLGVRDDPDADGWWWDVCTTHLTAALIMVDEGYAGGEPLTVRRLP